MPTVNPKNQGKFGNVITYEALTNVTGGQLVVPQTGATASGAQGIQPAGAAATNCIGVAQSDALTAATVASDTTGTEGFDSTYPLIDASVPDSTTAVYTDVVINVTYTGAVAYGQRLKCAAAGAVAAWVDGTDTDQALCVGWCAQPGGVTGAGTGLARIRV
jgi:hypothetical protein